MTLLELVAQLKQKEIKLSLSDGDISVRGKKKELDGSLLATLREHKPELIKLLQASDQGGFNTVSSHFTSETLSLNEIATIAGQVRGGAANIQDIYPLAPLQEGILFHHLMSEDGDPYLLVNLLSFDSRTRLDSYTAAMQAVVDRHDILRTAIIWDELTEPVQVVLKQAALRVEEVHLDPAFGDIGTQLRSRFGPRHYRIDISLAPLIELHIAEDSANGRWLLLLLLHHLAGDHTTLEVMQEEIQAYLLGKGNDLPMPVPFRNFIAQSRHGLSTEDHEIFFRKMLGDIDEPTAPFGLTDVRGDGTEISQERLMLDQGLSQRIRQQARRLGVSAATLCHVAWAQVLARTSARQEVVFGTVLFGRMHGEAGAGRAMGLFINTLPIRISVGQDSAETTVRNTHRQVAALLQHEHATLALAQRCSAVPAPAPLFSSLLNYRYAPDAAQRSSPEAVQAWQGIDWLYGEERTNYPVTLSVDDWGSDFTLTEQVDSSIAPLRMCEFMRTALESLVDALEHEPLRPLSSLEVLPATERRQVLEQWNDTTVSFPDDECIHELFEQQVARTPAATALVFQDVSISYEELNRRANRLAHHLRGLGVVPDSRVALCVERGPEMIVALLAVLKAGGAYVPLDPTYPAERLLYMLEDSSPAALITQSHLRDLLPQQLAFPVLDLDTPEPAWHSASESNPDPTSIKLTPLHLAYIIYTSGSTGNPKGVMVAHQNVARLFSATTETFHFNNQDSWTLFHSYAFDFSVWEIWGALLHGATLVIVPQEVTRSPEDFLDLLRHHKITVLNQTPSAFRQIISAQSNSGLSHHLRYVIFGGEAFDPSLIRPWYANEQNNTVQLFNMYGITETTVHVTCYALKKSDSHPYIGSPIGTPLGDLQIYILDTHGQPVPIGVSGEIHIGGAGVARGYLNRPELTAERFIPNPFVRESDARMYRTGDLGRWLPDGNIEFLGRNDFQVKVRGFRIELGEIEARLAEVVGVRDAIVIAREDTPGDKRLVAYYTSSPGADLRVEQIRAHLSAILPEYMVPAAFVALESIPLTPNGKLDRKALPSPEIDAYATAGYEEPVGEIENALAQIWADILKVERVGRNDNFFDLGGHSLLAVRIIVRIRQALMLDVAFQDLFLYPSVGALARQMEKSVAGELLPILPADRQGSLPLSFAQQRLWFLSQLEGVSQAYHAFWGARLKGRLDIRSLRRALDYIVARHETLRTTFVVSNGEPIQAIAPVQDSSFHLLETDLSSQTEQEAALHALVRDETRASFDLERGPLIRGHLIKSAEDDSVLLIAMHHIVSDGWSMGILSEELSALYASFLRDDSASLPDLSIQYADYAVWQRERMQGDILQEQAAYWKTALAGIPSLLELPSDHPRPMQQSVLGAFEELVLDQQLTTDLKDLSRRHGTTLYMTLLAAWTALLSRLSGQTDIVTGTSTAGRGRTEIDSLIGFFVNTLAIRIDLSGALSVAGLLAQTKERFLLAQQHQEIPFEQVVELAQPARSLSHSPIFQVMFAWHNTSDASLVLPGLEILPIPGTATQPAKFDLTLSLFDAGETIRGGFEYATALFEPSTIRRFIGYFRTLLEAIVLDETQSVSRISILPATERRQVLEQWNDTTVSFPDNECIHELFEQQVARTPAATALVFQDVSISYEELNRRANRLAHHLRGLGVVPDSRVALCVERGPEMIVALLAVLKAGGAYVPLDPTYPAERLLYMLEDSSPAALITQSHLRDLLPQQLAFPVLDLDTPEPAWHSASESNPDPTSIGLTPLHLAYIIYTSGSTGNPKGVMVAHRGICNYSRNMLGALKPSYGQQFAYLYTLAADLGYTILFLSLLSAGTMHIVSPEITNNPVLFFSYCRNFSLRYIKITPSHLRALLADSNNHCSSFNFVFLLGGEPLPPSLLHDVHSILPKCSLYNHYGPTEATIGAIFSGTLLSDAEDFIPIGKPIANTQIYILDTYGQPVPIGVSGEIHIGGAGVARGYLNRPELTAERFIPNPFVRESNARMYRTGDLGRWLPDGNIEFLGRNDFQVKIRGFRIELGEIEARLAEVVGVRDAIVIAREDTPGDKRLVAYYTSSTGADLRVEQIRAHLSAILPEYMVPAAFVALESIPLTPNGKLDRKLLPSPETDAYATAGYEEPVGEIENALAQIWADILKVERVGRNDNFFDLGGHSLLAIQLIAQLQKAHGIEIDIGDIFSFPHLLRLADHLRSMPHPNLSPILPADRQGSLPLSFAQQRLWFLSQLEGVSQAYHVFWGVRLKGRLDIRSLRRALDYIVARHETLRTTFVVSNGEPIQAIAPVQDSSFHLLETDLSSQTEQEAALHALVRDETRASFDLERGPLIRGHLIKSAEDDSVLLIAMHHIVSDGWSKGILSEELSALYASFLRDDSASLPHLNIQYADYAVWQRERMQGDILQEQAAYWKTALAGIPSLLELPSDHPRPMQQSVLGAFEELVLDQQLTTDLKDLSRRHGTTLYMTLLAAWTALLSRLSGQTDIVTGTPTAGRGRTEIDSLIGFFVNTLAIRIDLSGALSVAGLLAQTKERFLLAQQHQEIPFEQVVELAQPARSLSHSPIFQVMFAWHNTSDASLVLPGLEILPIPGTATQPAKFDLTLSLFDAGETIRGGFEYATALFEPSTIRRFIGYFRTLLEAIVLDETQSVSRISILPATERRQVLEQWNDTTVSFPDDECIHELFEQQVARTPAATALVFQDVSISYEELNRRANRLAHHLRGLGVVPDSRVALCVERGPEMIVALLAVLKAGGAYVPLDPTYPAERLLYMLEDSSPAALITQSHLRDLLPQQLAFPVLDLDTPEPAWHSASESNPDPTSIGLTPLHLAYIIYTSGSTGNPKGVMVAHRGICNMITAQVKKLEIKPYSRVLQFASFSFDASVYEIWTTLTQGAALYLLSSSDKVVGRDLAGILDRFAITHVTLPPPILASVPEDATLPSIDTLILAGDALSASLAKVWRQDRRLINAYGPTESTVCASLYLCDPETIEAPPIGKPIANTQIYILDTHGQPVPIGVSGEIHIGGAGVARGYLNRPELTAERFIPNPFVRESNARMYRTGDLGRWLPDGNIEFLGRNDFQVKIRGFRIELGEIEARLAEVVGVRDAIVIAREDTPGDKRLVAYYTSSPGADLRVEQIRAHLSAILPEYMVPAAFVALESIPLTPNGKLDRKLLPSPETDAYATAGYEEPVGEIENALAQIWAEALKVERVGRNDNFFDLGGHSLLAVRIIERAREIGITIDIRSIFIARTLAELATAAKSNVPRTLIPPNRIPADAREVTPEMLPLVDLSTDEIATIAGQVRGGAANIQDIYPLAPLQEGILFHHLMSEDGDPYLLVNLLSFDSRTRLDSYTAAMQAVVDRHDILRTAIIWDELTEPVQVVLKQAALRVEEVHLDPAFGDIGTQLRSRFSPRHYRLDISLAPLIELHIAEDSANGRWLLLLLLHHLAGDHTTLEVMQEEIQAYLLGKGNDLPMPVPFRNFIAQSRHGLSTEDHEIFFRKMLGDIDEPTAPFGLTDVRGDGTEISQERLMLDQGLSQRIRQQARRLGVSAATLCHVAWAQVLARTSARQEVVFGTVLFGRMHGEAGAGRAMGLFINTLPIRISVGQDSAETTVRNTHRQVAALLQHEHATLALAQRCSAVPAPAPLFSSLLNYRYAPDAAQRSSPEAVQAWQGIDWLYGEERTNYPFTISVDDFGDIFGLVTLMDSSIAPLRMCEFMRTALESLVDALEHEPLRPLSSLEVLPATERRQVLEQWNDTTVSFPDNECIHELFEQQVARTPAATALVFQDVSISYEELNRRANRLAHHLRGLGVVPDSRVALCVERGPEMIVALLAVLKAGGAYVPLDPTYPAERLLYMLEDSSPAALITQSHLRDLLPQQLAFPVLDLDTPEPAWHSASESNPDPTSIGLTPLHLAYIIYTSGSTGNPKGVMVAHRGICNMITAQVKKLEIKPYSRVLQFASFSFDASVYEIWTTLTQGAALYLLSSSDKVVGRDLAGILDRFAITHVTLPPPILASVPEDATLPSIDTLILAGDALSASLAKVWRQDRRLINAYGPTESTVCASLYLCDPETIEAPPIGKPIANTQIYILDTHGQPVPIGVSGEIHIGGAGVARGYLNRPELTAERFIPNPFVRESDARMYRTGDLGRWLPDGNIEFLGRNDFQVKIRGFRIELEEIEARLAEVVGVRDAIVIAREDTPGDKRLVAYYTSSPGADLRVEQIRAHLSAILPEYMVPAAFVALESIPLTPNGKLDRKSLPSPEIDAYATAGYEEPVGEIENALAQIWAEALKVERIGRNDNFFDLGGYSLLAVRVISRIQTILKVEANLLDLFVRPVLSQFAERLESAFQLDVPPSILIPSINRQGSLPLSFAQQRLWFLSQIEGVSQAYHVFWGVRLKGRLDIRSLRRALDYIVARHETLRTTFVVSNGEPIQAIAPVQDSSFHLLETDLSSQTEQEAALHALVRHEARASFDLERGPLIRGHLIKSAEDDSVLLIAMHHIVSDAWSMGILSEELSALYASFLRDDSASLPDLSIQYADYAVWQRERMQGDILQEQAAYWKTALAGIPSLLELPSDHPRPMQQSVLGAFEELVLDQQLTTDLKDLSRRHGTTLYMTLLAAWTALLSRLSGQTDIVTGTPTAGRGRTEIDSLIGFFVNTLAIRIDLSGALSVAGLLAQTKERFLLAQQHQEIPFEQVVELAQPARSLSHSPIFQVMFAWHNTSDASLVLPGLEILPMPGTSLQTAKFDLTLSLFDAGETIRGGFEYATALFEPSTIRRFIGYFRTLLEAMVLDETQSVSRISILPATERRQVLEQWNDTTVSFPDDECIHELFEQQVARTPAATALVFQDVSISYEELNRRANRLAHHLRGLGVVPDSRVALCVERGPEMIVALLAVLKAGGAYVPLDPTYPAERLLYMLEDSSPAALITQSHLRDLLPQQLAFPVLDLDTPEPAWHSASESNPDPTSIGLTPLHLAYIIYTSGSTGNPKGVMVAHQNVARLFSATTETFHFNNQDSWTLFHSYAFDFSVWEIWGALLHGATLVIVPQEVTRSPEDFLDLLRHHKITVLNQTPSAFRQIISAQSNSGLSHHLRYVIFGGEALDPSLIRPWYANEQNNTVQLFNMYGITETTVLSTSCALSRHFYDLLPIGTPLLNTQIYILDTYGQPVPIGVSGEIHIGGAGVARGYLNRPELTAERFIPNPFVRESDARMYRTGDLGRWLPDGNIEFLGRNDFQVKIRGFRIELGEIEARLAEVVGVRDAIVIAREDTPGDKRLVAYYTSSPGADLRVEQIRAHLSAILPEYMVPAAFVALESIPLTPNGKLDRKALPSPEIDAYATAGYEEPVGEIENALAQIWAEALKVERVGRNDNFFDLGGHSLLLTSIISRINVRFQASSDVNTFFTTPTIAALADSLSSRTQSPAPSFIHLRHGSSNRCIFFIHCGGGTLHYAHDLAPYLPIDLNVYGLLPEPPKSRYPSSVEAMAARMVEIVRSIQPHGPYLLAGWCLGGLLAYEMAAHFIGNGESVDYLGLLDSPYPPGLKSRHELNNNDSSAKEGLLRFIDTQLLDQEKHLIGDLRNSLSNLTYLELFSKCEQLNILPQAWINEHHHRTVAFIAASHNYTALKLPIRISLFLAEGPHDEALLLGWHSIIPNALANIITVGGNHLSMLTLPHLENFASAFVSSIQSDHAIPNSPVSSTPYFRLRDSPAPSHAIVCVPGAGADVASFFEVINSLDDDHLVYAVQPLGVDGHAPPHVSVETAAKYYWDNLPTELEKRPLHLVGHSFGGLVAFQMALDATHRHIQIASITLLDSPPPDLNSSTTKDFTDLDSFIKWLELYKQLLGRPLQIADLNLSVLTEAERRQLLHKSLLKEGLVPRRSAPDILSGPLRAFATCLRTTYRPQSSFPGAVQLIIARDYSLDDMTNSQHSAEMIQRWRLWTPSLATHLTSSNHMTMLRAPNASIVADYIRGFITQSV